MYGCYAGTCMAVLAYENHSFGFNGFDDIRRGLIAFYACSFIPMYNYQILMAMGAYGITD